MITELSDNGIKYNWELGPKGGEFTLLPIIGLTTRKEIGDAKEQLRKDCDAHYIYVKWVTQEKHEKIHVHIHIKSKETV